MQPTEVPKITKPKRRKKENAQHKFAAQHNFVALSSKIVALIALRLDTGKYRIISLQWVS